jgi:hypothetical protein
MRKYCLLFVAAAIATLTITSAASASSIYDLSTGIDVLDPNDGDPDRDAGWQVIDVPSVDPNNASAPYAAYVIEPNTAWTPVGQFAGTVAPAEWISAGPDYANAGYDGQYVYELSFAVTPGRYLIAGEFNSDNGVSEIAVNGDSIFSSSVERGEFQSTMFIPAGASGSASGGNLIMRVVTENLSSPDVGENPTGFILSGTATLVPLPAAAWGGLALLGGMGGVAGVRRKLRRS